MGSNTMKGLLKGLRYISNIFEAEEKEPEMQIGLPTDVKHVAHIGWDGPAVSAPSWMSESKPESSSEPAIARGKKDGSSSSRDVSCGARNVSPRDLPAMPMPKPSKRNSSSSSSSSSAGGLNPDSPRAARHARRHQSNSVGEPDREKPEGSRHGRRERSATTGGSDIPNCTSAALQQQEQSAAAAPKPRRRKSKEKSSSGGSAPRSKAVDRRAVEQQHLPPLEPIRDDEEEDGCR